MTRDGAISIPVLKYDGTIFVVEYSREGQMYFKEFVDGFWSVEKKMHRLAALDSLAEEPSEDAREFASKVRDLANEWMARYLTIEQSLDNAAALITARDERIRRECADRAVEWLDEESGKDYPAMDGDSLRYAITGEAKK